MLTANLNRNPKLRKRDTIKVLDVGVTQLTNKGFQCQNCKERHYLVGKEGDNKNLFCTNCGHLTPIRTIKQSRGLTAPIVQQPTALIQSANKTDILTRKPRGINTNKRNPLEQSLVEKGFTVIDSQVIEPAK